jgi:Mg-chelatase subunit ChlD
MALTASLTATPCRTLHRAPVHSRRYVRVLIQAPPRVGTAPRAPVHAAFCIDRSGSMQGDKLRLACDAASHALGLLSPTDRFSIVTFDSEVEVAVPLTAATPDAVAAARRTLHALEAGRTTAISDAWIAACEQLAPAAGTGPILRTLLLSDGQANVGMTTSAQFAPHVAALREHGVHTSVFGLGLDFDEEFLAAVARAGGGNFHFIGKAEQIPAFFAQELGESLDVVARRPVLRLEAPPHVRIKPLSDFPHTDVAPGVVVLRVDIGPRDLGAKTPLVIQLADDDGAFRAVPPVQLAFESAPHAANDAQRRDVEVDRAVARIYAALAEREAIAWNRRHAFDRAERVLNNTSRRIMLYAGSDPELNALAEQLKAAIGKYTRPMDEYSRKSTHAGTVFLTRSRGETGWSKRHTS